MYGQPQYKPKTIVLPVRQALEVAVQECNNPLSRRIKKALKRNAGIIFKRQWFNVKSSRRRKKNGS